MGALTAVQYVDHAGRVLDARLDARLDAAQSRPLPWARQATRTRREHGGSNASPSGGRGAQCRLTDVRPGSVSPLAATFRLALN